MFRLSVLFTAAFVFASAILTQGVTAETATKAKVKCKSGIVRESASSSANCAFCVSEGEEILVLSEEKGKDGNTWYKISLQGKSGYIRSDLVTKSKETVTIQTQPEENAAKKPDESDQKQQEEGAEQSEAPAADAAATDGTQISRIGKVKGTGINVRKEPVDGKVVTRLTEGDKITANESVQGSDGNTWYAISFVQDKNPLTGYIRADFTEGIRLEAAQPVAEPARENTEENTQGENTAPVSDTTKRAFIRGTSVRIRDKEVNGAVVVQLNTGHDLEILDEKRADDQYTWYHVRFTYQGATKEGYVRSDLVNMSNAGNTGEAAIQDEAFESVIRELPESYKNPLRSLHAKYPKWKIVPVNTGLNWQDAVTAECAVGKNLTSISSIPSWKSTDPRAYNSAKGTWYGFDGGSWASASPAVIKYYMDPRNFLDDAGIFQFETLEFQEYQNESGCASILTGSFMSGSYTDTDGVTRSYANTFVEAGRQNGVSPYHLASRCLQEQGLYGTSACVTGNTPGYENFFNYFNIGAYAANGLSASINGLIYAKGTDEAYSRPWNSRFRSVLGAAKYVSEKYVAKGQNTLYFQKFNMVNAENGIYSHQYMSNICAASTEGARLKRAYPDLNTELTFRIPYYKDMPSDPCPKPTSDSSPNNTLESLSVSGYELTPAFSAGCEQYKLQVGANVREVTISAKAADPLASVGGTGTVQLNSGSNVYYVVCKAQNGSTKTYTITIDVN
ncbi:MAG: cadherin-like beta sandwich domain-containing protein [Lachnospiraceae bacterium]|nr:cadherin-like beta sandwich domain-containing protein [Lachnospiraceae bacterium]